MNKWGDFLLFQEFLLVLALIPDAFAACFAYGTEGIRIPVRSALLIGGIGTGVLLLSMLAAAPFKQLLPPAACGMVGNGLLLLIGLLSVFQNSLKAFLSKKSGGGKSLHFRWADISFAVTVYLDETKADADRSKTLSLREAAMLGLVLSLDSFGAGFGSGFTVSHPLLLAVFSLLLHPAVILLAQFCGRKTAGKLPRICSAAGGFLLIGLAVTRMIG